MSDDQSARRDSGASSVEKAAEEGPLPEDAAQEEPTSSTREDFEQREGMIPQSDNDLDPDRNLSPEERQRAIAEDETIGGIFQRGGRVADELTGLQTRHSERPIRSGA